MYFQDNFSSLGENAYYILKAGSLTCEGVVVEFKLHAKPRLLKRK